MYINLNIVLWVSLSFSFRMRMSSICGIGMETCDVLWKVLAEVNVRAPSSERVTMEFYLRWNFSHCVGIL